MKSAENWGEEWKKVVFPGIHPDEAYEISNQGRIRRYNFQINDYRVLKAAVCNGYYYFAFKADPQSGKKRITKLVHRLVAEAYCEKPSEKHNFVLHLNYNKLNNLYTNLRWGTRDEMIKHSQESPNYWPTRTKGRVTNAKLTETEVMRIKKKLKRGKTALYKIAKEFGITHTQLNRIRSGENWGHIKVE
ncbi:MAG: NUMOD4 domain-containing protein [Bacteroidota bacterium]